MLWGSKTQRRTQKAGHRTTVGKAVLTHTGSISEVRVMGLGGGKQWAPDLVFWKDGRRSPGLGGSILVLCPGPPEALEHEGLGCTL